MELPALNVYRRFNEIAMLQTDILRLNRNILRFALTEKVTKNNGQNIL